MRFSDDANELFSMGIRPAAGTDYANEQIKLDTPYNRRARFIVATADLSAKRDLTTMRFCLTWCPTMLVHPHQQPLQRVVAYPDFIVHQHDRVRANSQNCSLDTIHRMQ